MGAGERGDSEGSQEASATEEEKWSSGSDRQANRAGQYRHKTRPHNMVRAVGRGVGGEHNGRAVSDAAPLSSGGWAWKQWQD